MEYKCLEMGFECYEIACSHVENVWIDCNIFEYECMVKNTWLATVGACPIIDTRISFEWSHLGRRVPLGFMQSRRVRLVLAIICVISSWVFWDDFAC